MIIIGGGFAGISLAKKLARQKAQVIMLDKHNYHTFQPLLYQVSTGGLEPDSIAYPIRKILSNYSNFFFRLAEVNEIDTENQQVISDIGNLEYDYLVLATGSVTNYFGNKEAEEHSMGMKTIPEALDLRSLILENFEQALLEDSKQRRDALMNFVIVGAGPTGVELAGALAEIKKGILPHDYPDLEVKNVQINLLQATPRVLDAMSEHASRKAEAFLTDLGVNVFVNTPVTSYDGEIVKTNSSLTFRSATVIWAAGVKGATVKGLDADDFITRMNRIKVNEYNLVKGFENIFAVGDIASMETEDFPQGHPMMAQPAIQQGRHLGDNFERLLSGKAMEPFKYNDKGSMATIGRNKAVVDFNRYKFHGMLAWFLWMFVHLFFLIGFRNRLVVFVNWVYNYIRFDKEARLIIRPYRKNRDLKI